MKVFKFLFTSFIALQLLASCNGNNNKDNAPAVAEKPSDNELKAFMAGGVFFINGWGGKTAVENHFVQKRTADSEIIKSYREVMILPYKKEDGGGAIAQLKEYWDVNNIVELDTALAQLESHRMQSSYTKAWDYARYVKIACMGYAGGYLSEMEAKAKVTALLPKVEADYKSWEAYFADFKAGLDKWDSEGSANKKDLEELSGIITTGEHNIYHVLPLN